MAYFVIAGKTNCLNTTHALYVADLLTKNLPHFVYRTILTSEEEWPSWLDQANSTHNWHETRSPVIWKEVNIRGGKPHLIGCLGEFWEYCYDYYGFQSKMPKNDLGKIMADNMIIASKTSEVQSLIITIIGASNEKMLELTIYELQNCENLKSEHMEIRIYDQRMEVDPEEESILLDLVESFRSCIKGVPQKINVMCSEREAIEKCDVLIITDDYSRHPNEEADAWLDRCRQSMLLLADDINHHAKRNLKVILNHQGPICFNASVLMEYCTTIRLANIVAITADEGMSVISMMAEECGEPVENCWCPPVWGFSGLLSYINLFTLPITTDVFRPYKRSLRTKESSNLPKGIVQREIRFLGYVIKTEDDLYEGVEDKISNEMKVLHHKPILPKARALGSLLRLWFADEIGDDIISLGICSSGAYGFPPGICFSQVVSLNQKRIWEAITYLPLHTGTVAKIESISLQVENTLQKFGLGQGCRRRSD